MKEFVFPLISKLLAFDQHDLIEYRAIFYLVYCKESNEIYQIELFTTPEEFTEDLVGIVQSFKC